MNKIYAMVAALVLAFAMLAAPAFGDSHETECVPAEAYTETSEWVTESPGEGWYEVDRREIPGTPAVPEIKEFEFKHLVKGAVEEVPALWANFAPSDTQDTFVGPPEWDTDPRGEWIIHYNDEGPGQNKTGVYPIGNPDVGGNWFYRQAGVPGSEAVYEYRWALESPGEGWTPTGEERIVQVYVPGTPDVTEFKFSFDHKAVTCEEPPVDECVGENGEDLCTHEEPEPPVVKDCEHYWNLIDNGAVVRPTTWILENCERDEPRETNNPRTPEPVKNDPVVDISTHSTTEKTVKVTTHESGRVTREVTHYDYEHLNQEGM